MKENRPKWFLKFMTSKRKIIETVISQLNRLFNIQKIRVRDMWHMTNRITRKILTRNICKLINLKEGLSILDIEPIVNKNLNKRLIYNTAKSIKNYKNS